MCLRLCNAFLSAALFFPMVLPPWDGFYSPLFRLPNYSLFIILVSAWEVWPKSQSQSPHLFYLRVIMTGVLMCLCCFSSNVFSYKWSPYLWKLGPYQSYWKSLWNGPLIYDSCNFYYVMMQIPSFSIILYTRCISFLS